MKRIYHPYWMWEDFKAGMWRIVPASVSNELLAQAIRFTGDATLYGQWMIRVIDEWPISCEHNLTDMTQNRRAWVGHAATQLAINCPEYITRAAWGQLNQQQQNDANDAADMAIAMWEKRAGFRRPEYAQMLLRF